MIIKLVYSLKLLITEFIIKSDTHTKFKIPTTPFSGKRILFQNKGLSLSDVKYVKNKATEKFDSK